MKCQQNNCFGIEFSASTLHDGRALLCSVSLAEFADFSVHSLAKLRIGSFFDAMPCVEQRLFEVLYYLAYPSVFARITAFFVHRFSLMRSWVNLHLIPSM